MVGQKVHLVFFHTMALVMLSFFNFIRNNFVRLYGDSCHFSVHFLKLIKMGKFLCGHFNIEDGRRYATFLVWHALLFQER